MRRLSITDLESLSFVKAHTIRIWEKRYGVCCPQRSISNLRQYSVEELKRLLDVSLLNRLGHRISSVAGMNTEEIARVLDKKRDADTQKLRTVHTLITSLFSKDMESFEATLDRSVSGFGIDSTLTQVIVPFMERIRLVYYHDKTPEVHFAVAAIRKKLIVGIESLPPPASQTHKAVLFLPLREHFDLMLLYMTYCIRKKGIKTLYLGTDISADNLRTVCADQRPTHLITYLPPKFHFDLVEFSAYLGQLLPESKLVVCGFTGELDFPVGLSNVLFIKYEEVATTFAADT